MGNMPARSLMPALRVSPAGNRVILCRTITCIVEAAVRAALPDTGMPDLLLPV